MQANVTKAFAVFSVVILACSSWVLYCLYIGEIYCTPYCINNLEVGVNVILIYCSSVPMPRYTIHLQQYHFSSVVGYSVLQFLVYILLIPCALLLYTSESVMHGWRYQGLHLEYIQHPLGMRFGLGGTKWVATHTAPGVAQFETTQYPFIVQSTWLLKQKQTEIISDFWKFWLSRSFSLCFCQTEKMWMANDHPSQSFAGLMIV